MNATAEQWFPMDRAEEISGNQWHRTILLRTPPERAVWEEITASGTTRTAPQESQVVESLTLDWLPQAIEFGPDRFDVHHLAEIVSAIDQEMSRERYALLGRALAGLPVELLSPHVLSTVLRVASAAKHFIPNWYSLVEGVQATLSARGLDSHRVLRGLT